MVARNVFIYFSVASDMRVGNEINIRCEMLRALQALSNKRGAKGIFYAARLIDIELQWSATIAEGKEKHIDLGSGMFRQLEWSISEAASCHRKPLWNWFKKHSYHFPCWEVRLPFHSSRVSRFIADKHSDIRLSLFWKQFFPFRFRPPTPAPEMKTHKLYDANQQKRHARQQISRWKMPCMSKRILSTCFLSTIVYQLVFLCRTWNLYQLFEALSSSITRRAFPCSKKRAHTNSRERSEWENQEWNLSRFFRTILWLRLTVWTTFFRVSEKLGIFQAQHFLRGFQFKVGM